MSSSSFGDTLSLGGVFATDPAISPMTNATKVYVMYCTSDAFGGDVGASDGTLGWAFRGQRVVGGVFAQLARDFSLGATPNTTLVFGGTSAGGRGAMFHLDARAAALRNPTPPLQPVAAVGLLDSPYWVDLPPLYPNLTSLQTQTESIRKLANITAYSVVDPACAAAFSGSNETWKCLFGVYRLPFLKTQYLLLASSSDSFQLGQQLGHAAPFSPNEAAYADAFATATLAGLATLPAVDAAEAAAAAAGNSGGMAGEIHGSNNPPNAGVYSQACYNHAVSTGSQFYASATDDGLSEAGALALFLSGLGSSTAAPLRDIDGCGTFACGTGCAAAPATAKFMTS
jgi:hypothetical protein